MSGTPSPITQTSRANPAAQFSGWLAWDDASVSLEEQVITKYYYAGGQRVAVRKDGELSYLLSETMYKPCPFRVLREGETRYSGGAVMPTDRLYTGQIVEPILGLYFYNARWYDSSLSRFAQADALVPNPSNPQSWDRYSYTMNNPIRYNDPTGHIAQNEVDEAEKYLQELKAFGVEIAVDWGMDSNGKWKNGRWELRDLITVRDAVLDLANFMGGVDNFRVYIENVLIDRGDIRTPGHALDHHISLDVGRVSKWTVVHELAHIWDENWNWGLSVILMMQTGGYINEKSFGQHCAADSWLPGCNTARYYYGDIPPKGADINFTPKEDFAESVATCVYPDEAQAFLKKYFLYNDRLQYTDYTDRKSVV